MQLTSTPSPTTPYEMRPRLPINHNEPGAPQYVHIKSLASEEHRAVLTATERLFENKSYYYDWIEKIIRTKR